MNPIHYGLSVLAAMTLAVTPSCWFGSDSPAPAEPQEVQRTTDSEVRQLLVVHPTFEGTTITIREGDMVQLAPFSYPLNGRTLGATLEIKLSGGRVLDLVGQADVASASGEGRASRAAFLLARTSGRTVLEVSLVDADGKPLERYRAKYDVYVAK